MDNNKHWHALQNVKSYVSGSMDQILSYIFEDIVGCKVFNAREWIERLGEFPAQFWSTEIESTGELDYLHGSPEYYRQLTKEIFNRFAIKP